VTGKTHAMQAMMNVTAAAGSADDIGEGDRDRGVGLQFVQAMLHTIRAILCFGGGLTGEIEAMQAVMSRTTPRRAY
jgi:hypothetical protein